MQQVGSFVCSNTPFSKTLTSLKFLPNPHWHSWDWTTELVNSTFTAPFSCMVTQLSASSESWYKAWAVALCTLVSFDFRFRTNGATALCLPKATLFLPHIQQREMASARWRLSLSLFCTRRTDYGACIIMTLRCLCSRCLLPTGCSGGVLMGTGILVGHQCIKVQSCLCFLWTE